MTEHVRIEEGLYARVGKRVTSYSTMVDGQRFKLGHDLEAARKKLAELRGRVTPDDTIAAMCRGYIKEQRQLLAEGDNNALGERTIDEYEISLERNIIPVFGQMRAGEFKSIHAAQYLAKRRKANPETGKKAAPTGANRDIAALASAFHHGIREGMVEANPCRGVKRNKERPRNRKVTVKEFNAFMQFAKDQTPALYMAALIGAAVAICGRRRIELLAMTRTAMSDDGVRTLASKTKPGEPQRTHLIRWSPLLVEVFKEALRIRPERTLYVFPTEAGTPYTDPGFKCTWNKLMTAWVKRGGEHFRAHDLRAFYVTEMLEQDRDPNTHRNAATMMRVYDRRREIEVMPLA